MNKNQNHENDLNEMHENVVIESHNNFSSTSRDDNIKPILAYFAFTTKYIMKKKSTMIAPLISFLMIMLISLFPKFILNPGDPIIQNDVLSQALISMITIGIIASSAVFSTIKALNLFKDISNEGMEILIVSKPIKRSQIILVRFLFFLLLGIVYSIVNYFAILIGLFISKDVRPDSLNIFDFVSTSYLIMIMSYILFGSISIMLSLKFSTKLVSGASSVILAVGIVLTQVAPVIVPLAEKNFFFKMNEYNNTHQKEYINLKYYETTDGEIILYTKDITVPLTDKEKEVINNAWQQSEDLSWILNLNNFINPVAGISKISNPIKAFYNKPIESEIVYDAGLYTINFSDYNVALNNGPIKNNSLNNKNYFIATEGISDFGLNFNLKVKVSPDESEEVEKSVVLSGFNQIQDILRQKANFVEVGRAFENLIDKDLSKNPSETKQIIINGAENVLSLALEEITTHAKASGSIAINLYDNMASKITTFDEKDFKEQLSLFFFYTYGLMKLNGDINKFNNKDVFINSIVPSTPNSNTFLDTNYARVLANEHKPSPITPFVKAPLFFELPKSDAFQTFINKGEKVSKVTVGLYWSSVILVILTGTVLIYYRKDFT
ncbi:MAG: hypothetical protein ACRCWU_02805 [Metamycoplasmataceae bacterium]